MRCKASSVRPRHPNLRAPPAARVGLGATATDEPLAEPAARPGRIPVPPPPHRLSPMSGRYCRPPPREDAAHRRSEEHTSELQSLMRISYAVFCLNKKRRIT